MHSDGEGRVFRKRFEHQTKVANRAIPVIIRGMRKTSTVGQVG
ncbi:hypothetical protein [Rhodococcus pseudokoreensis]|nr:hypothetical protein [Rhodococcus pseudokoreensis]